MLVFAESSAWIGVAGTVVGGVIVVTSSWLLHRWERGARLAERSRAERKEAYAAFLTNAEDSMHLFQWLTKDASSAAAREDDEARADKFYDGEVVPRYRILELVATRTVLKPAREMRVALNDIRHLMKDSTTGVTRDDAEFKAAHTSYRRARDAFLVAARADLE